MNKFSKLLLLFLELLIICICIFLFYYQYVECNIKEIFKLLPTILSFFIVFCLFLKTFFTKVYTNELIIEKENSKILIKKEVIEEAIAKCLSNIASAKDSDVEVFFKERTKEIFVNYKQKIYEDSPNKELEETIEKNINNCVYEITQEYPKKINILFEK